MKRPKVTNESCDIDATGIKIKEELKYVKLKISDLKVQKEQFDKLIAEKNDQLNEDQELYNILAQELNDKTAGITKL